MSRIRISYGVVRKTVPMKEVVSCKPTKAGFWLYGGIGIRIGANDSLAFTTSMGKGVLLLRANGRAFVFSTKRPAEVVAVIDVLIAK